VVWAAALAVAVYVTKVPVPFIEQEPKPLCGPGCRLRPKNTNWDPNAPLYGKNPAQAVPALPCAGTPARVPKAAGKVEEANADAKADAKARRQGRPQSRMRSRMRKA